MGGTRGINGGRVVGAGSLSVRIARGDAVDRLEVSRRL